jgi:DNA-binding transcriptional ArsR family regulator
LIGRLRQQIQERLDQLIAEADKLRHALRRALAALNPRTSSTDTKTPRPARAAASSQKRRPTAGGAPRDAAKQRASTAAAGGRTPRDETKRAVLAALDAGNAITAGEVAAATGLARATFSTTLTKLAKTGEVAKAQRGYHLPTPASSTDAAAADG